VFKLVSTPSNSPLQRGRIISATVSLSVGLTIIIEGTSKRLRGKCTPRLAPWGKKTIRVGEVLTSPKLGRLKSPLPYWAFTLIICMVEQLVLQAVRDSVEMR